MTGIRQLPYAERICATLCRIIAIRAMHLAAFLVASVRRLLGVTTAAAIRVSGSGSVSPGGSSSVGGPADFTGGIVWHREVEGPSSPTTERDDGTFGLLQLPGRPA